MKKIAVFLMSIFCVLYAKAQQNYPIRTIFKGDSVVILTTKQSNLINNKIALLEEKSKTVRAQNLALSEQVSQLMAQNQKLESELQNSVKLIDSLKSLHVTKLDTFLSSSHEGWTMSAAVSNNFLHMDWSDPTIKWVDLRIYRRGDNAHFSYFRLLRNDKKVSVYTLGGPNDYYYNKKNTSKTVVYEYPFRFIFNAEEKTESK